MKHFLESQSTDAVIAEFPVFDKDAIKAAIVRHLTENPDDTVEHHKESKNRKYYGDSEILNFYMVNPKTGGPSRVVTKGARGEFTYYIPLT
jgi:hypothetical protein